MKTTLREKIKKLVIPLAKKNGFMEFGDVVNQLENLIKEEREKTFKILDDTESALTHPLSLELIDLIRLKLKQTK